MVRILKKKEKRKYSLRQRRCPHIMNEQAQSSFLFLFYFCVGLFIQCVVQVFVREQWASLPNPGPLIAHAYTLI